MLAKKDYDRFYNLTWKNRADELEARKVKKSLDWNMTFDNKSLQVFKKSLAKLGKIYNLLRCIMDK